MADEAIEAHDEKQIWGTVVACVLVLILLMVFYILSIGPVVFALELSGSNSDVVASVFMCTYFPIIWIYENFEAVQEPIEAYVMWWTSIVP